MDELHADLALADTWVADTVLPFLDGGAHRPASVDVPAELRSLIERAFAIERSIDDESSKQLVKQYADYAALLAKVYQRFLSDTSVNS